MATYIVLDLESAPHPDAANWLEPVTAAGNLKDPAKIAASITERTAERDDKLGLDPDTCRIVALGYIKVGHGDPVVNVFSTEQEERDGIGLFVDAYRSAVGQQETKLVTFYGHTFDLPVLMRRAWYLNVTFPVLNLDRFKSPHIDLWQKLAVGYPPKAHSLKFYQKRLGLPSLDKIDGADIAGLVKQNTKASWDAIAAHCESDVSLTHALANRMGVLVL